MSSILTNTSAMVALQTMKSISTNLSQTTAEISTGKRVASAKDNAAVWAISKVMESDVQSFKGISDSLSLGSSTIAVARQAAETVTSYLTQMKAKIVAAQESNVDRTKIQTDIEALRNQISSVVGAAQFNGLNLVDNNNTVNILSSLDRSGSDVTASSIGVDGVDLSIGAYAAKDVFDDGDGVASAAGDTWSATLDSGGNDINFVIGATDDFEEGDSVSITISGKTASYTFTAADVDTTNVTNSPKDIAAVGLQKAILALGISDLSVQYDSANAGELLFHSDAASTVDLNITAQFKNQGAGGLGALDGIDVSDAAGAAAALGNIEGLMTIATDAAAAFGSAQTRVDTQKEFIGKLVDSMKAGIGSLVDADMEEASARLQALQVQQQLSTQALSIANQQPQALLSLFR